MYQKIAIIFAPLVVIVVWVAILTHSYKENEQRVPIDNLILKFCSYGKYPSPTLGYECIEKGLAFFIDDWWRVATSAHLVFEKALQYRFETLSGRVFTGRLISLDRSRDTAYLQIEWITSRPFEIGETLEILDLPITATAYRYASGGFTVLTGTIDAKLLKPVSVSHDSGGYSDTYVWLLSTDIALEAGDSGWPVLDSSGRVIGISLARNARWNGSYVMPLNK